MSFVYENYLTQKLYVILNDFKNTYPDDDVFQNMSIQISTEQAFFKEKSLKPETIYIIIKYLQSSIEFKQKTQPIQLFALSEANSLDHVKMILDKFSEDNNWRLESVTENNSTTYIKQQYSNPVVISNFNEVSYGYRSVVYVSGTLFYLPKVLDIKNVKITIGNTVYDIEPLNFQINYSMTGNTQQIAGNNIAQTVKSVATVSISMTLPLYDVGYVTTISSIMNGTTTGNTTFNIKYNLGESQTAESFDMKLISCSFTNAPNQIPGLQLGFMR